MNRRALLSWVLSQRCRPSARPPFSGFPPFTTTAPRAWWSMARSWRPPRKSGSRARSTTRAFPRRAVQYCLKQAGIGVSDLDYVVFYEKPLRKFERLLETYLAFAPTGFGSFSMAMPVWLKEKTRLPSLIREGLGGELKGRLVFTDHHESHAASAFFPSPYDEAAILTLDGVGEWSTTTMGVGPRQSDRAHVAIAVPSLARAALLCRHVLLRLQGQQRRVQADGPGAVWPSHLQGPHHQAPGRPARRRQLLAGHASTSTTARA